MPVRNGCMFGKVSTCYKCGKRFKYVIRKERGDKGSSTSVCKPCSKAPDYPYQYEGYVFS